MCVHAQSSYSCLLYWHPTLVKQFPVSSFDKLKHLSISIDPRGRPDANNLVFKMAKNGIRIHQRLGSCIDPAVLKILASWLTSLCNLTLFRAAGIVRLILDRLLPGIDVFYHTGSVPVPYFEDVGIWILEQLKRRSDSECLAHKVTDVIDDE